jgi:putative transposase
MRKMYPTDLTDEQWAIIQPLIPPAKSGGRARQIDMRELFNTLFYQNRSGCQWDMLPHDLLPKSTAYDYFARWRDDGTWQRLMDALRQDVRRAAGKEPTPSAAAIDSQTVKTTEIGGIRGYDGGKKINGRKRHIIVDTLGLLLAVVVTSAKADDGNAAPEVLRELKPEEYPRLRVVWGDKKYRNTELLVWMVRSKVAYQVEVMERPDGSTGFVLVRKRWVVERTFAWLGRYRRHSKDYEYNTESSEAMLKMSMIHRLVNRLKPKINGQQPPFKYQRNPRKAA